MITEADNLRVGYCRAAGFDLERALQAILVHFQQLRHGMVAKVRALIDDGLNRHDNPLPNLQLTFGRFVEDRLALNAELATELDQTSDHAIIPQGLLQLEDHLSSSFLSSEFNFFLHAVPASPLRSPPAAHGAAVRNIRYFPGVLSDGRSPYTSYYPQPMP
jgi:hypothetical protein